MRFTLLLFSLFLSHSQSLLSQSVNVTFRVDMRAETVAASGVHIAGNFQAAAGFGANWNPASTLLSDADGDKIYALTVSLPPGTYEYKFINGNAWGQDENPPGACSVGNTNNREMTVGNVDLLLPVVPFNGCIETLRLAVNMTGQEVSPAGVHVMGDFQVAAGFVSNWDPSAIRLSDANGDGTYEVELVVPAGDYQYLFVNGNMPEQAEDLPADCAVAGSNGLRARRYTFAPGAEAPPVYCFNQCTLCSPAVVFDLDAQWWNDAVFYEVFVRSFYDSNGDGIGDFRGLTEKLDYLNDGNPDTHDDLGITGIWLMPMLESPSYHGYDVTNYYKTEPDYGTMEDFEAFLAAAHQRGIKVIIDLVLNHSSSQNPWFVQSANNTGDFRDWYIWSPTNPGNKGPWGQTVWHSRGGSYYYGLFYDGMPDLNYTHPPVKAEMFNVVDFWLGKGVDGYRLDAIKYLVETGGQLEDTPETFAVLEEFHDVYKAKNPQAFTVGEVWSSTSSIIPYVQKDRLDACFEFGLAGAILDAVNNGNTGSVEQQLETVLRGYPALQYATFLTNHDIDRVFSVLGGNTEKMKLAASLYLTLPGVPFVYYGEELGLTGTGDHLNIRRPMPWTGGANGGFSSRTPWNSLGGNYVTNNVATMAANPQSLLRHYQRLIRIRNEHPALRRGQTLPVADNASQAFSFARIHDEETIIVVANTSTQAIKPILSLAVSALPAGTYEVMELLTNTPMGTLEVDAQGGFANWQPGQDLAGRTTWVLRIAEDSAVSAIDQKIDDPAAVHLVPNPANEQVRVLRRENASGKAQVDVFSSGGRLVFQAQLIGSLLELETRSWPAGMYWVRVTDKGGSVVKRLVVAR
ncbi:MAG: T9SS type A sorting domain-containing protein [Lewinellaceae bacterium]|nr:T9SS type A sorting domain-containing protein [Lewinellaceae bacterium]